MSLALALLFAQVLLAPVAQAQEVPLRPLTYNLDPKLSEAPIANFLELYVDPARFVAEVRAAKPPVVEAAPVQPTVEPAPTATATATPEGGAKDAPAVEPTPPVATAVMAPPTGTLLVLNDRGSWADVAINGKKIGKIGPQIYGVVGPVPSGGYKVSFTYANGFVHETEIWTTNGAAPGAFGGEPSTLPKPHGDLTTKLKTTPK